jgi:hypothetical protein
MANVAKRLVLEYDSKFAIEQMPITTTYQAGARRQAAPSSSGDHIGKVTPVPIPNTVVKLSEPMVVPKARE